MLEQNGFITNGTIYYKGQLLNELKKDSDWEKIRGKEIATIFQDPMTSLNQSKRSDRKFQEVIVKHQKKTPKEAKRIGNRSDDKTGIP